MATLHLTYCFRVDLGYALIIRIRIEREKKIDEKSENEKSQFDSGNLQERKHRVL